MSRPAVFLDRDGVVTVEKSYVCRLEDLEIYPYAKECVDMIHKKGYLAIVVTNQSAVGRHMMKESILLEMNKILIERTGVDDVFYCPHWHSLDEPISDYNIECNCRKPKTGMIDSAQKKYNIDVMHSYMIGDRSTDILLGKNIGIKTILVKTGYGAQGIRSAVEADYICDNLTEACKNFVKDRKISKFN